MLCGREVVRRQEFMNDLRFIDSVMLQACAFQMLAQAPDDEG